MQKKGTHLLSHCDIFDHPDLEPLNNRKICFFGLLAEILGVWGLVISRSKGLENISPTLLLIHCKKTFFLGGGAGGEMIDLQYCNY